MDLNEEELKTKLTPEQYHILREKGTEAPFSSPLLEVHDKNMDFACVVCGNILFKGDAKFESGTGWPSFDQALPGSVKISNDNSHGMSRTEVTCSKCGSHLGHVFNDGPATTGQRYCINGACLLTKKI
ncbi:MAG: peptide-methionine (R)-S-oxide reductase MsrB [Candidatus Doudnabacteria bacterium]|nr:peptide-methionine (R)-S-oxide reductase MsrB [Candidatus Doudnabacteria bacterium]